MTKAFANISFTPNVKQIQVEMGSRQTYKQFENGDVEAVRLSKYEKDFIKQRDSFYQATVSQNGWPYVQHRGGPKGFIKIIDDKTIGYADFSGNRQYISVGNMIGDDRISLILMNYQQQRRLKILGRVRLIDESIEPDLIAKLEPVDSRAPIERGVLITVEAFDWNCPKYITPRFSQQEAEKILAQYNTANNTQTPPYNYQGNGAISLVITAIEQVTDEVRTYRLTQSNKLSLPSFQAGAYINVPVQLDNGTKTLRSYSLINSGLNTKHYNIAVKLEKNGDGGSIAIHNNWQIGQQLNINTPTNYFGLHQDNRQAILIAGGIGITPIMAMAEELSHRNINFKIHYASPTREKMAFMDYLSDRYGNTCSFYFSQDKNSKKLDLQKIIKISDPQVVFYICGPKTLLEKARKINEELPAEQQHQINFESFK